MIESRYNRRQWRHCYFLLMLEAIAVVGTGRMGNALASALRATAATVEGPLGRGSDGAGAELVILCVPDAAIAEAARVIAPGRLVGHCSGASTLAPLAPHEAFSLHPLTTVSDAGANFAGAGCAIAGSSDRARGAAWDLAVRLGMRPFAVSDADRDLYHAAATLASNYLVTIENAAEGLAATVGVERSLLVPLVRTAVENWARLGGRRALTGPIARGDEETVARQRAAVAERARSLLPLWDALTAATRQLAAETVAR